MQDSVVLGDAVCTLGPKEIKFSSAQDVQYLSIINICDEPIKFKVRSKRPELFRVKPPDGIVDVAQQINIQVELASTAKISKNESVQFQVQVHKGQSSEALFRRFQAHLIHSNDFLMASGIESNSMLSEPATGFISMVIPDDVPKPKGVGIDSIPILSPHTSRPNQTPETPAPNPQDSQLDQEEKDLHNSAVFPPKSEQPELLSQGSVILSDSMTDSVDSLGDSIGEEIRATLPRGGSSGSIDDLKQPGKLANAPAQKPIKPFRWDLFSLICIIPFVVMMLISRDFYKILQMFIAYSLGITTIFVEMHILVKDQLPIKKADQIYQYAQAHKFVVFVEFCVILVVVSLYFWLSEWIGF